MRRDSTQRTGLAGVPLADRNGREYDGRSDDGDDGSGRRDGRDGTDATDDTDSINGRTGEMPRGRC
ncbi:hypothetical protein BRD01_06990 [Halobacteriales archaeon QS_8_65_32]|jgi:hypothetical protein|nr:MAG: hypothetical protein BRD01_06990 [Halobacteriales archaeon QS_8_65_32]